MIKNSQNIYREFLNTQQIRPDVISAKQLNNDEYANKNFQKASQTAVGLGKEQIQLFSSGKNKYAGRVFQVLTKKQVLPWRSIKTVYNLTPIQLAQCSVYSVLTQIFIDEMHQLVDIEDYIDPETMQPSRLPSGMFVAQFINHALKQQRIPRSDDIDGQPADPQDIIPHKMIMLLDELLTQMLPSRSLFEIKATKILTLMLSKINEVFQQFYGQLQYDTFYKILFNENCYTYVQKKKVKQIQQQSVEKVWTDMVKSKSFQNSELIAKGMLTQAIQMKSALKQKMDEKFFSEVSNPPKFNQVVNDFMDVQKKLIVKQAPLLQEPRKKKKVKLEQKQKDRDQSVTQA